MKKMGERLRARWRDEKKIPPKSPFKLVLDTPKEWYQVWEFETRSLELTIKYSTETLSELPPNLTVLICNGCHLQRLPPLPEGLVRLECRKNHLVELPPLPESLQYLRASYNLLEILPPLPSGLRSLSAAHNHLTQIEVSYLKHLSILKAYDNPWEVLPEPPLPITRHWNWFRLTREDLERCLAHQLVVQKDSEMMGPSRIWPELEVVMTQLIALQEEIKNKSKIKWRARYQELRDRFYQLREELQHELLHRQLVITL